MTEALKMYMDKYSLVSIRVTNSRKIELPFLTAPAPEKNTKIPGPPSPAGPLKKFKLAANLPENWKNFIQLMKIFGHRILNQQLKFYWQETKYYLP